MLMMGLALCNREQPAGNGWPDWLARNQAAATARWAGDVFTTLPVLMQPVQTRIRLDAPLTTALTGWRFTFQRRRVVLFACEMLLPNCGPLPQIEQTCAMTNSITG